MLQNASKLCIKMLFGYLFDITAGEKNGFPWKSSQNASYDMHNINSNGSTTLPIDLDIFPWLVTIQPWEIIFEGNL